MPASGSSRSLCEGCVPRKSGGPSSPAERVLRLGMAAALDPAQLLGREPGRSGTRRAEWKALAIDEEHDSLHRGGPLHVGARQSHHTYGFADLRSLDAPLQQLRQRGQFDPTGPLADGATTCESNCAVLSAPRCGNSLRSRRSVGSRCAGSCTRRRCGCGRCRATLSRHPRCRAAEPPGKAATGDPREPRKSGAGRPRLPTHAGSSSILQKLLSLCPIAVPAALRAARFRCGALLRQGNDPGGMIRAPGRSRLQSAAILRGRAPGQHG